MSYKIRRASDGLEVPPHSALMDRVPQPDNPPCLGTRRRSCLSLSSEFPFPASQRDYSAKPVTPSHGARGHLVHLILQSLLPQLLPAHCVPTCSSVWPCMAGGALLPQVVSICD